MTCFITVDLTPTNKEQLIQYSQKAASTVEKFQGQFLVKGEIEKLHGEKTHIMKAIIQFPNEESAINWYNSDEYQALIPLREEGMISQFHLVKSVE